MIKVRKNIIGQKFGHLTIISQAEDYVISNGHHYSAYWCQCDCGNPNLLYMLGRNVTSGHTKSCGCSKSELISVKKFKKQEYEICGDYVIGKTGDGTQFIFDKCDLEKVKARTWWIDKMGYVCATNTIYYDGNKKNIKLHRLILDVLDNKNIVVDHINHNPLDNRRANLRICPQADNMKNQKTPMTNKSGTVGVRRTEHNTWVADIGINGKSMNLGTYKNFEDAVAVRKAAEEKYFGEYSYDNSMKLAAENSINYTDITCKGDDE